MALRLLEGLGLVEPGGGHGRLTEADLEAFDARRRSFGFVHLATVRNPLASLRRALGATPALRPPRTCHLGNLANVFTGRAGLMDYELPLLRSGLGRPHLFELNQTEDEAGVLGDRLYRPGSRIENGTCEPLELHTWGGSGFELRRRSEAYLAAFVATSIAGSLVPLTAFHRGRLDPLPGQPFGSQARFLHKNAEQVRNHIEALVSQALASDHPERRLEDVLDRAVRPDGRVRRRRFRVTGGGLALDGHRYAAPADVAAAAMLPLRVAADPSWFLNHVADLPPVMPLVSNHFLLVEAAILGVHWGGAQVDRTTHCKPLSPHVHWGGMGMAGTPPSRPGYLTRNLKRMRKLATVLVRDFADVDPVYFVLAPVPVFALAGSDVRPADAEALEALIRSVLTDPATGAARANEAASAVAGRVAKWRRGPGQAASPYFRRRFSARRAAYVPGTSLPAAEPVLPPSFWRLTVSQASMVVGALLEQSGFPG